MIKYIVLLQFIYRYLLFIERASVHLQSFYKLFCKYIIRKWYVIVEQNEIIT